MSQLIKSSGVMLERSREAMYSHEQWSGMMLMFGLGLGMLQFAGLILMGGTAATAGAAIALYACAHASLRHSRLTRHLQDTCAQANRLVAESRLDEAKQMLLDASKQARFVPHMHALLLFSRGIVELLAGSLPQARALFTRTLASGWLSPTGPLAGSYPEICLWMSLCEVISGDLRQACAWRWRVQTPGPPPPALAAHHLFLDVLIETRQGNYERALARLETGRPNAHRQLNRRELATLDAVEAFARERSRGGHYRQEADRLDHWRESEGVSFDYMTVCWPELAQFLEQRGFSGSRDL